MSILLYCTHCKAPVIADEVPFVSAVLECSKCQGVSYVQAQYLLPNGRPSVLLIRVPREKVDEIVRGMEALR